MGSEDALDLDDVSFARRFVLLGLVDLDRRGETPATSHEVKRVCSEHCDALDDGVVGSVSEPEVMRALYALEDVGLVVEEGITDASAVGKGRPEYGLATDRATATDALASDDALGPIVDSFRPE